MRKTLANLALIGTLALNGCSKKETYGAIIDGKAVQLERDGKRSTLYVTDPTNKRLTIYFDSTGDFNLDCVREKNLSHGVSLTFSGDSNLTFKGYNYKEDWNNYIAEMKKVMGKDSVKIKS